MGHPVTTNPFIIMLINMTVVFIVLISLSYLIRLIHYVDPTKPKEVEKPVESVSQPEATPAAVTEQIQPVIEEGISPEVVAVIFAAIAGYGYSEGSIHAVRIANHEHTAWEQSARFHHGME